MDNRILFLSYLGGIGGGESFLLNLMQSLRGSRFTPMIAVASPGVLITRCIENQIPVFKLEYPTGKMFGGLLSRLRFIAGLVGLIRANNISLLHINDMELGKYGAVAARICRVPTVWTCHGWWYSGPLREIFYRLFIDLTVAVSSPVLESLIRRHILPPDRAIVINPGVDISKFIPLPLDKDLSQALGVTPNNVVVAIVGRFQPIKGHAIFLKAAREVVQRFPDAVFLVVGGNVFGVSEDAKHQMKIYEMVSHDFILRNHVKFVDFQNDMPRLFSLVDVLVSASEAETFGMIHLEAMSCGCPVVSTNVGGPAEIVLDGKTGFLVPPGDFSILAEKICLLCESLELRKSFGELGRKRAEENFALELQTQKYIDEVYGFLGI